MIRDPFIERQIARAAREAAGLQAEAVRVRDVRLAAHVPPPMLPAKLAKLRTKIAETVAEIRETESAGPSRDEVLADLRAHCERLAEQARGRAAYKILSGDLHELLSVPAAVGERGAAADLGMVLAAVLGADALYERLTATIDSRTFGPDAAAKAERLATLRAELLRAERAEEAHTRELEAGGFAVVRRADANPAVVLALEV